MAIDPEQQELILLRILGVLLILVGFAMIARSAPNHTIPGHATLSSLLDRVDGHREHCRDARVEVRSIEIPVPPPPPRPSW